MLGVERRRLSEQVAGQLREWIVGGEIGPGQTLPPERALARRFAVSSTVIREALRALSTSGLLEIRHGVGSFVTSPDHWRTAEPIATLMHSGRASLLHVLEIRASIEVEMSGHAAERRDDAALAALDAALARMESTPRDPEGNVAADMEFHHALAAATRNPILPIVLQPILAPIHLGMLRGTRLPDALARALDEHGRIRAAVAARDPAAARAAMRAHMRTSRRELEAAALAATHNGALPATRGADPDPSDKSLT